jgi:hypothetical protein
MHDSMTAESQSLRCPLRGLYEHTGRDSAICLCCSGFLSDGLLEALRRITERPDIMGWQPASAATRR